MSDESPDQNPDQSDSKTPEEETRPPITIYYQDQKMENLKTGLTSEDLLIATRLEKLREDRMKDVPKDNASLEQRLADLKGTTPGSIVKANLLLNDSRSTTEKAEDLLKQFLEELRIDKNIDPHTKNDIESGLASLKTDENTVDSDSADEEQAVNKLVQRYTEEAALQPVDDINSDDELESPHFDEHDEVNTWCIICNEDATLKCLDCEGDIYCYSCFHKGHEEWNMNHHKPITFKKTSEE